MFEGGPLPRTPAVLWFTAGALGMATVGMVFALT